MLLIKNEMNKPHFQKGTLTTCLLLSAPGLKEQQAGKPLAGQSGKNLNAVLAALHKAHPNYFQSVDLNDYRITNAVDKVLSKTTTVSTEGVDSEIVSEANLKRIRDELENIDTVIAFGNKAALAIKSSGFKGTVLLAEHPSYQNINFKYRSNLETPSLRNEDRLNQWLQSLTIFN